MKHTFFVLLALFFMIGVTNAQDSNSQTDKATTKSRVHMVDHLLFITGKVYRSQQGQLTAIEEPVRLENGMTVKPDGTYQIGEQKHRHLRDGECFDMVGNRYENLMEFDNNRMIRQSAKDKSALKEVTRTTTEGTGKTVDRP